MGPSSVRLPDKSFNLPPLTFLLFLVQDTGFVLFNKFGCGESQCLALEHQIKSGERSFRDVSEEMWGSLNVCFDDGFEVMKTALEIDPDFREFHSFCQENDIPFVSFGSARILELG